MRRGLSRRAFVQAGAAVAGAAALGVPRSGAAQPGTAPLRVRKNALLLDDDDPIFEQYGEAVRRMHGLPANDRRNWRRQAEIHADLCAHGQQHFLGWHRHYVNEFEKICGSLIGDDSFALPYWDWTQREGIVPNAFFDQDHLNVTFWNDDGFYANPVGWPVRPINTIGIRAIGRGVGVQTIPQRGAAFTSGNISQIIALPNYRLFFQRLEGSPHNMGHVVVGFPPAGRRGHIGSGLSPLDPLFWLHHANVDRIWAQWQLAGNTTPSLPNTYDGNFVDANGDPVNGLTADNARDFESLGYTYEDFRNPGELLVAANLIGEESEPSFRLFMNAAAAPAAREPQPLGGAQDIDSLVLGSPQTVSTPVRGLREAVSGFSEVLDATLPAAAALPDGRWSDQALADFGKPKSTPRRILAVVKNAVANSTVDPVVNVYLNCPYLTAQTGTDDPHYAGTFAFFGSARPEEGEQGVDNNHGGHGHGGHGHGGHEHGASEFVVDITDAVRNTNLTDVSKIDVQFVPLSPNGAGKARGEIEVGAIELVSI